MEFEPKIRPASREDSKRVWEIRNHPLARKNFHHQEEIPFAQHDQWFEKKYFGSPDNHCFVLADEKNQVLGYCRFDFNPEKNSYLTSIAIDPSKHGQGLGYKLLNQAVQKMATNKDILAEIKIDNIPSIKIFQKCGYKIYGQDKKNYYLKYQPTKDV